jgi:hypothetical protein
MTFSRCLFLLLTGWILASSPVSAQEAVSGLESKYGIVVSGTVPPARRVTAASVDKDRKVLLAFDEKDQPYRLQPFVQTVVLRPYDKYKQPGALITPNIVRGTSPARGRGDIDYAWLANDTGVPSPMLGLPSTAKSLVVLLKNGKTLQYDVPGDGIIEDAFPHIVDMRSDGYEEILVTLRTAKGAAVGLFLPLADKIKLAGITKPVPVESWVNTVGAADVDGDKKPEILVVTDPGANGWLELYEWRKGKLIQETRYYGFSNMVPGTTRLQGSALADFNDDGVTDLLCVRNDRLSFSVIGFSDNGMNRMLHYLVRQRIISDFALRLTPDTKTFRQAAFLTQEGSVGVFSRLPLDEESLLE